MEQRNRFFIIGLSFFSVDSFTAQVSQRAADAVLRIQKRTQGDRAIINQEIERSRLESLRYDEWLRARTNSVRLLQVAIDEANAEQDRSEIAVEIEVLKNYLAKKEDVLKDSKTLEKCESSDGLQDLEEAEHYRKNINAWIDQVTLSSPKK
ncbi:MAG: hypothetical protein NTZ68_03545 [Candidatus Dependentiae bacterium]|nr:hypothetical protein [Candidatus Dependentiae bacterium]